MFSDMPIQDQTTNYTYTYTFETTLQWTFQDKAVVTNARGNGKYNQNCCYRTEVNQSVLTQMYSNSKRFSNTA
jgi:hypothetical protein